MKNFKRIIFLLFVMCTANGSCSSIKDTFSHHNNTRKNYLIADRLSDNEQETRIRWKGLSGKETTLDMDSQRYANSSIQMTSLWQITDGKKFAQLIFSRDELIDCEFLVDGGSIADEFLDKFEEDNEMLLKSRSSRETRHQKYLENAIITSNATIVHLKSIQQIPEHFLELMNLRHLQKKCNQLHKRIRHQLRSEKNHDEEMGSDFELQQNENGRTKRQTASWFIAPGTFWCGRGNLAEQYKQLGPSQADTCCRRHDHCKMNIPGLQTKFDLFNVRPITISHCKCDRRSHALTRSKRQTNSWFIVPGTKWCGKEWTATKYSEIGGYSKTDKCCRSHDFCPHWIGSFEQKWSLFNWSINVIMHCKCDERFRTCLKMADASDANMVGKLFFNIVQIKCFVLKQEKTCILFSWWGKCLKYKIKKKAYLRNNQKY